MGVSNENGLLGVLNFELNLALLFPYFAIQVSKMEEIQAAIAGNGNIWTLNTSAEIQELYKPLRAARASNFTLHVKAERAEVLHER